MAPGGRQFRQIEAKNANLFREEGLASELRCKRAEAFMADILPFGPRERLVHKGVDALSDEELLAILLGTGVAGEPVHVMAHRLLAWAGGLDGLVRVGVGALAEQPGVGIGKASRIIAAIDLGKRLATKPLVRGSRVMSSRDVAAAFHPRFGREPVEHFFAIPLDANNRVLGELLIGRGGLTHCPVAPRDVFRMLIREAAYRVFFLHNHPTGEARPSQADLDLTKRLEQAGALLGVQVVDHVILGADCYFSFRDEGLLDVAGNAPAAREQGA